MTQDDTTTREVVKQMRALREQRGWSVQQLADRCAAAGLPSLNRSVLANLEAGRRTYVTLQELLTIAEAFNVAPVAFLTPGDRAVFCGKYAVDREVRLIDLITRDFRELLYRVRDVVAGARAGTVRQEHLERLDDRVDMLGELLDSLNERLAQTPHVRVVGEAWSTDAEGRRL